MVQSNNKQIKTVTGRKSKECVTTSNNAAEEKKAMENWINRFDQLFLALCKSEQMQHTATDEEFSVKLNIKGFQPSDVELVVDTDNKLIVKGRREVETEDEIYDEEFHEILDLPNNIDDEEISVIQDKNGCLVIKAPFLSTDEAAKSDSTTVSNTVEKGSEHWSQLFDELFIPLVNTIE